jgi:hypothetical protein
VLSLDSQGLADKKIDLLPCPNVSGKRWQPAATVFACFRHFRADPICR